MIKIKNLDSINTSYDNVLLRIEKSKFKYPYLKSTNLLIHISNPIIEKITIHEKEDSSDSSYWLNDSKFKNIFVKAIINCFIELYNYKSTSNTLQITSNLDSLDLYLSENIQIIIDDTEFCVRKDLSELTVYDFSIDTSLDKDIVSPVNEFDNYYLYKINIKSTLNLNPLVNINSNEKSFLLTLNNAFSKNESNYEFTRGELSTLNILSISNNPSFNFDILKYFINLNKLNLLFNYFEDIPIHYDNLTKLSSLTSLNLSENNLTYLPNNFGSLTNLKELYLCGNKLISLPNSFTNLYNLSTLYIYNNKLTSLPNNFSNLSKLSILYLDNNNLKSLPKEIGDLENLSTFNLSRNNLSLLPNEICKLSNLFELSISFNNLSTLPNKFNNLSNLRYLNIEYNKFNSFPKQITKLKNLISLNISSNEIISLPNELNNLESISYIFLSENKITNIPNIISDLKSLKVLILDKNKICNLSILKGKSLILSAKNQLVNYGFLEPIDNQYKLNLSFLRDNNDKLPKIINISNQGYLQCTKDEDYIIWNIDNKNNTVFFDFDNNIKSDDFKFSGCVSITLS